MGEVEWLKDLRTASGWQNNRDCWITNNITESKGGMYPTYKISQVRFQLATLQLRDCHMVYFEIIPSSQMAIQISQPGLCNRLWNTSIMSSRPFYYQRAPQYYIGDTQSTYWRKYINPQLIFFPAWALASLRCSQSGPELRFTFK